jgi:hypothetical protein
MGDRSLFASGGGLGARLFGSGSVGWATALTLALAFGCRVPRQVHEPRQYPPIKLHSPEIYSVVVDSRESGRDPTSRQLVLPKSFETRVQERLAGLASGAGVPIGVILTVAAADELEIVDARGEMTRVLVRLELEIKLRDGAVVRRAETQSTSDLPREEATPEEVAFVLDATAIDAFDRYFADAAVLTSLNRELEARH